jgi:hypothetical protein
MMVNPETCMTILPTSFFDGDSSNLYEIFISRISPYFLGVNSLKLFGDKFFEIVWE